MEENNEFDEATFLHDRITSYIDRVRYDKFVLEGKLSNILNNDTIKTDDFYRELDSILNEISGLDTKLDTLLSYFKETLDDLTDE